MFAAFTFLRMMWILAFVMSLFAAWTHLVVMVMMTVTAHAASPFTGCFKYLLQDTKRAVRLCQAKRPVSPHFPTLCGRPKAYF
jgi:hypothetical protein